MVNEEIKSKRVNVINEETKGLTEMSLVEAIKLAKETDEDVILISDKGDLPVVKIYSYSKYMYEKQKKDKENKKKQRAKAQELKEIQISTSIMEHDMSVKAKNIERLLTENNKVQVVIKYKGREIRLIQGGEARLRELISLVEVPYKIDREPKIEGNRVTMLLSPSK